MATDTVLITHVTGQAWMRASDGTMIALHEGMRVPVNAHILTNEGASVTLQANGVPPVIVGQNTDMLVTDDLAAANPQPADNAVAPPADTVADQVLAALDAGQDPFAILDPTAATLAGGGGGGDSFVRLLSNPETTTPLDLAYPRPGLETPEFVLLGGAAAGDDAAPLVPAGPTLNIPDGNDVPGGGDGQGPTTVPGTFSIRENNTYQSGGAPSVPSDDPNVPSHGGVSGIFTLSAAAGLGSLQFTYVPESDPAAPEGANPGGGGSTAAPVVRAFSASELAAATEADPLVIDTDRGLLHITGYDPVTGVVSYTYWSDGAQTHDQATDNDGSVFDTIGITVVDGLGRAASADLVANILDTQPLAYNDANQVTEDTGLFAKGNVITGWHETSPADGKDSIGADDTHVTGVQRGTVGADETATGSVGTVIHGTYGDLFLNAHGFYVYKLVNDPLDERYEAVQNLGEGNGNGGQEVFTYTITDADGDTSTATLTVTVNGTNDLPTITFGGDNGAHANATVTEGQLGAGLLPPHGPGIPDGTDGTASTIASGTFTVADRDQGDSVASVTLGEPATPLTSSGMPVHWTLSDDGQTLTGQIGFTAFGKFHSLGDVIKVTLSGNPTDGYSYQVELLAPVKHPDGSTQDDLGLQVPIVVKDTHGAEATGNILTITIHDDAPVAQVDSADVLEDGSYSQTHVRGNVLTNDDFGADGPKLLHMVAWGDAFVEVNGSGDPVPGGGADISDYGTFKPGLVPGSWTFVLNNGSDATQALAQGETKSFQIQYTITDSDGDTSVSTLTINIQGTNDAPTIVFDNNGQPGAEGHTAVSEEGLPAHLLGHIFGAGNPHGAGLPDTGAAPGSTDTTNDASSSGHFTVADVDGDDLEVRLVKLEPSPDLTSDKQTIQWALSPDGQTLTGHIGHGVSERDVIRITLTKGGGGDYRYDVTLLEPIDHSGPGEDALNLVVPISVFDGHVTTTGKLNVSIEDDAPQASPDRATVHEDGGLLFSNAFGNVLANDHFGADGGNSHGLAITWGNATEVNASGTEIAGGADLSAYGTFKPGLVPGGWTFDLNNASLATQALGAGETKSFQIQYTITDNDGDTSISTLTINIQGKDDGVTVNVPKDHGQPAYNDTGDRVVYESGLADGSNPNSDATVVDAHFTIKALDGLRDTDAVKISYTDADGDAETLTITRVDLEALNTTPSETIYTQYGTMVLNGYSQAADGTITVSYTYTLTKAPGVEGDSTEDRFTVTATDRDGDASTRNLNITIKDDAPSAQNDKAFISEDSTAAVTGNVIAGYGVHHHGKDTLGADDAKVSQVSTTIDGTTQGRDAGQVVHGKYGDLTIDADGNYTYTLVTDTPENHDRYEALQALGGDHGNGKEVFTYTLQDGDHDESQATLTITVKGVNDAPVVNFGAGLNAVVSEEGLLKGNNYDDGIPNAGNDTPDGDQTQQIIATEQAVSTGTFTVTDVDSTDVSVTLGATGITVQSAHADGWALTSHTKPVEWDSTTDSATGVQTLQGRVTLDDGRAVDIIQIQLKPTMAGGHSTGEYTYTVTLQGAIDHPLTTGAAEDVLNLSIPITVSDGDNTHTYPLTVRIEDDSPQTADSSTVQASYTDIPNVYTGTVDFTQGGERTLDSQGMTFTGAHGVTIAVSAQGFTSATDVSLESAPVYQNDQGVGVQSTQDPYHTLPGEIDYRVLEDGTAASEILTVKLPDGKVAYSVNVEFSMFFGGEKESGVVEFWRGGTKIGEQAFNSDQASGHYISGPLHTDTFGAFDTLVFKATDNGNGTTNRGDNSDFGIKNITFDGPPQGAVMHAAGDFNFAYGADGAGGLAWAAAHSALYVSPDAGPLTQLTLTPNETGTVLTGTYGDSGTVAFQLILTQNGAWEYFGYQVLRDGAGKPIETLPFGYIVKDADGDPTPGTITIGMPVAAPTISVTDSVVTDEAQAHGNPDDTNGQYPTPSSYPYPDEASGKTATGTLTLGDSDTPLSSLVVSLGAGVTASWGYVDATQPDGINTGNFSTENPLQSQGQPVSWALVGNTLVAYTGADKESEDAWVIKVELTTANGVVTGYEITQLKPLDHQGRDQEDVIDLKIPVSVSDGLSSTNSVITVRIEDDSPEIIEDAANLTMVSGGAETTWTGSLGISIGADFENAHVQIVAGYKTSLEGKPVMVTLEGLSEPVVLTSDKTPLVYHVQLDGSVIAVKQGDTTFEPVFTVSGNAQSNTYTVTLQGVIDPPAGTVTPHLEGATFTSSSGGVSAAVGGDVPFSIEVSGSGGNPGSGGRPGLNGVRLGIGSNGYIDGQHDEKLTFTITPTGAEHVSSVEIQVYDLRTGETALVYVNGSATPISIPGTAGNSNSYQTLTIPVPEGADGIHTITLGAAGTGDYSVTSLKLGYETGTTIDSDAPMNLNLGAIVTDGDGDAILVDLNVSVTGTSPTTATLTSEGSGNEDSGSATYTVTLDSVANEAQAFDVTLTNGQKITITVDAGQTAGSVTLGWGDALTAGMQPLDGYPDSDPYTEADFALKVDAFGPGAGNSIQNLVSQDQSGSIAIGDSIDVTSATIKAIVTHTAEINTGNVETSPSFDVTAYKANGNLGEISIVTDTDHNGFGVKGQTSGGADAAELGYGSADGKSTGSEKIVVVFKNEVKAFDVEFAWRNNAEKAKVEFFDDDDKSVGWAIISGGGSNGTSAVVTYYNALGEVTKVVTGVSGGSDKVDSYYTFESAGGQTFIKAEFTAVGYDDDYLIHSIKYKEVVSDDATTIVKGSEVLVEIVTTNPPDPELFAPGAPPVYAQVQIGNQMHDVQLDKDGRGTVGVTFNGDGDLDIKVLGVNGNFEEFNPAQVTLTQSVLVLDAVDDHIITNILGLKSVDASIVMANDTLVEGNTKPLNAVPLTWVMPDADFGTFNVKKIDFTDKKSSSLELDRADFSTKNQSSNQAAITVNGHLADDDQSYNSDRINVHLNAGETLKASWNHTDDFKMEWVRVGDDNPDGLKSGKSFTAQESGEYQLHIWNTDDDHNSYTLNLTIDFANVQPIATGDYLLETSDGTLSDSAQVTVEYQSGNTLTGTKGNDTLLAGDSKGATLNGGEGDDVLIGGAKGDQLNGGEGNDILIGGKGSDTLTGGAGDDVFVWRFGDQGDKFTGYGRPTDHVTDFGVGLKGLGVDKLDLSDLLQNRDDGKDLSDYLQITGDGHTTTINVSTDGKVSSTHYDQQIVIDNANITGGETNQHDLINNLINDGKLKVDQG